jgi:hypothetical protein
MASMCCAALVAAEPSSKSIPHGGAFVPMDSWVYPVLDRLAALGYVPSQIAGLRPWTRTECRRQMEQAQGVAERQGAAAERQVLDMLAALHVEFGVETPPGPVAAVDSVYVRAGGIGGPALTDSYHFGQTWRDDFGRPFGRGSIANAGLIARMESGRFFGFVRGEFQHAPEIPGATPNVREWIRFADGLPVAPEAGGLAEVNRVRVLEGYAGVRVGNVAVSVGKQSMFWGPGVEAPLSFSYNAEPAKNLKVSTLSPFVLPGVLRRLGGIRAEFVMGKLGGHAYTWRPWFNAQKISFKLTENLEAGFTRWSIFWGVGHPATLRSFVRNFTSFRSPAAISHTDPLDPGDRKGGFDFRYRMAGLRNWVTLYCDSYSEDDPSPLAAPRRAAMSPGIWLTKLPTLPRMDLRVDVASTQPLGVDLGGQFNYYNAQYRSGNTNYGFLLGNPVGRNGRTVTARSTYWMTPRRRIEAAYRQGKTSVEFLPGGGTQTSASVRAWMQLPEHWTVSAMVQYERFRIPLLGAAQRNMSGTVQLVWEPRLIVPLIRK